MGPTALLPLRRMLCYGFLSPLKINHPRPGLNPRTLGPLASTITTRLLRQTSNGNSFNNVRFKVLTAASMMFRVVFLVILPCKMIVDRRFRGAYCLHHQGWVSLARMVRGLDRCPVPGGQSWWETIILHGSITQKTTLNKPIQHNPDVTERVI
jgi:hypothetical protein